MIEATRVVAYTYDAAVHCTEHALGRYGRDHNGYVPESARDGEGNGVGAIFASDLDTTTVEACNDDGALICLCCGAIDAERAPGRPCWNCRTPWWTE
jgi:hypothetical protein